MFVFKAQSTAHKLLEDATTNVDESNCQFQIVKNETGFYCNIYSTDTILPGSKAKVLKPWGQNGILHLTDIMEWKDGKVQMKPV